MDKILIVKLGALGDVIRTSYILPSLQEKYPTTQIHWLTADSSFDLLRFNPYIFSLVTHSFRLDSILDIDYDLILSLDDESHVLDIVSRISTKKVVGAYKTVAGPCYTEESAEWFDMGLISRYGKERADELKKQNPREHNDIFADMLGIEINKPCFFNSPVLESAARRRFDSSWFNIGLNTGSGSRWLSKQLRIEETIKLAKELIEVNVGGKSVRLYLLGGRDEVARHEAIRCAIPSDRVIDTGTENSILEFAAIVGGCDYLITSDSLSLHLAISQGVKNLSFYAPTSASEIGTFGTGVKVLSLSDDYCSYRNDTDNSTITAARIMEAFLGHTGCE